MRARAATKLTQNIVDIGATSTAEHRTEQAFEVVSVKALRAAASEASTACTQATNGVVLLALACIVQGVVRFVHILELLVSTLLVVEVWVVFAGKFAERLGNLVVCCGLGDAKNCVIILFQPICFGHAVSFPHAVWLLLELLNELYSSTS